MGNRRRVREIALQIMYRLDVDSSLEQSDPDCLKSVIKEHLEFLDPSDKIRDLAFLLIVGICQNIRKLDQRIEDAAENWSVRRLSIVDRNIIRLAVFEMEHMPEIPFKVIMNEAIDMAKSFSSEKSGKFVNGVLDKVYRILRIDNAPQGSQREGMIFK